MPTLIYLSLLVPILLYKKYTEVYLLVTLIFIQILYLILDLVIFFEDKSFNPLLLLSPILIYVSNYSRKSEVRYPYAIWSIFYIPYLFVVIINWFMPVIGKTITTCSTFIENALYIGLSIWVFKRVLIKRTDAPNGSEWLLDIATILLVDAFFRLLLLFNDYILFFDFGFNDKDMLWLVISLSILRMSRELIFLLKEKYHRSEEESVSKKEAYRTSAMSDDAMEDLAEKIFLYLEKHQVYLKQNLCLEEFAIQVGMSKHNLSQVLNIHIKKNFYRIMAEYRIESATERILTNPNIKLEALAYDCGFNSLSSFNRYFKEIKGITPSKYREQNSPVLKIARLDIV